MYTEYERRRFRRLPIELRLDITHMFEQSFEAMKRVDAELFVFDISKAGIGFISEAELPINYYFNSKIKLDHENFFYAVLKIVNKRNTEPNGFIYGAEFVGLAPFVASRIDAYEKTLRERYR